MHTGRVHRIESPVDWPPRHVAAYLAEFGDALVLVDAGMPDAESERALSRTLDDRGYDLTDVTHLLLTHPHVDHVGQVETVVDAAAPHVLAPAGVSERFARDPDALADTVRTTATEAGLDERRVEHAVEMAVGSLRRNGDLLPVGHVDTWLDHGDRFDVGDTTLETVHTPGHQADHCCYLAREDEALFAGDMAIEPFRPVLLHAGLDRAVDDAVGAFSTALDRLDALDVDRVYPGHGPVHDAFAETVARDRASVDRLLDRSVESVVDGATTAVTVAERRSGDRAIEYIVAEVVAALRHLDATGRLDSTLVDGVREYHPADHQ
ncbi:MBL fold metallo-hydrolase [Halomarina oriensis]|uniref:MBL fold metallo-hydrolase n=1 Tax=Halomarina oriensis TaxID=671145 RepID=A0A6B0GN76_9EURY|nr:MBL fold metallo-hydrolase [Halomarina oriensis]MWG33575.1 MBL fold metallo-hydrolase [Halomarina oriensis]